jgi:5-oxoprolinase (ATP-hydrolysing)
VPHCTLVAKHALWHLQAVREKGIQSVAVVLKNSYLFPDHERQVGELASELGFSQVPGHTCSSPDTVSHL